MRKWFNSDSTIIFNIIIALIVGIVFGNLLGSSMLKNEAIYANAVNYNDDVFILQTGHFYDESSANTFLEKLKKKGIDGLVVREGNNYFVYHAISINTNSFKEIMDKLEENQIYYLIKTKKLYYFLNDFDNKSNEYAFYYTTINYYLSLINNNNVILTDDYIEKFDVHNLDLYNSLNSLNSSLNSEDSEILKLYVYRNLVNLLT